MAKEIKQRIVLDGEKEYNQAIKEAQRNLRTLKSELKAETAEMGRNATEQQKAEAKAKSLRQQIAEQEKVVKTLKDALAEVREKYGDNADEVARWEQRLNNARTVLANMQNDLEGVGGAMQRVNTDAAQVATAAKSASDSIGNIGSAADSISGAIEGIFGALVDRVTAAASAVWDLIAETAAKANNWTDLAALYGTSTTEIQKWQGAIQATQGDFGKFTTMMNTFAFGDEKKQGKIAQWFMVSKEGKNDMEYTLAVLENMANAYKEFGGTAKWDTAMSDIFGTKKSADAMWFVTNWEDIVKNAGKLQGGGYLIDEDQTETMNQVWLELGRIEKKWEKLQEKFAAGFGTVTLDIMTNVEGMMDGVADYMNAETPDEQQQALDKIRTNIEQFFTKVGELIRDSIHIISEVGLSLKESDDPLVAAVGEILVQLADKLQWLTEHAEEVKGAFETIFGAWLLLKLAAVAGKLSSILMSIEAIKAFRGVNLVTGAAEGAGAGAGASGAGAAAAGGGAVAAVGTMGILAYGAYKAAEEMGKYRRANMEKVLGTDENLAASSGGNEAAAAKFAEWVLAHAAFENLDVTATDEEVIAAQDKIDALLSELQGTEEFSKMLDSYNAWRQEHGMSDTQWELPENMAQAAEAAAEKAWEEAAAPMEEAAEALKELIPDNAAESAPDADAREAAIQAWWDAYRTAANAGETGDWDAEQAAFDKLAEILGEETEPVMNRIMDRLEKEGYVTGLEDLPQSWWMAPDNWNGGGLSGQDVEGLKGVPGQMAAATRAGIADGLGKVRVIMDRQAVGWLVAPTVSEYIAGEIEA